MTQNRAMPTLSSISPIHHPSPNYDARPPGMAVNMVVLHYTNMTDTPAALARLCDPAAKVSAHYVIDENGQVYALVDEALRAWHAGQAFWAGTHDINGCSIGIELSHIGHDENGICPPFPASQMSALLDLLRDITARHKIPGHYFLGHSDVAPTRKTDPGESFDWPLLAEHGFGFYSKAQGVADIVADIQGDIDIADITDMDMLCPPMHGQEVHELQQKLADFGYNITPTGIYDAHCRQVVTAFQRHFRRHKVDGHADRETRARLLDLLGRIT